MLGEPVAPPRSNLMAVPKGGGGCCSLVGIQAEGCFRIRHDIYFAPLCLFLIIKKEKIPSIFLLLPQFQINLTSFGQI
jgi:hypothetical protein